MRKHVTIKDIAEMSGVSIATVSRVLNHASNVNEETRAQVTQVIEKMNYKPNPAAKALVSNNGRLIAAVVPNLNHSVISQIVKGITQEAQQSGFDVLLFDYDNDARIETRQLELLGDKLIEGAIILTSIAPDRVLAELSEKVPLVLYEREIVSAPNARYDIVETDDDFAMKLIIDYLRQNGHRNIGMLTGERGTYSADKRAECFARQMKKLAPDMAVEEYMIDCEWSMEGGFNGLQELVRKRPDVTAVICANDQIAHGALGAANQFGIRVPDQLSVIGYDNFTESNYSAPPLTTLSYPAQRVGEQTVKFLLKRVKDPKIPRQRRSFPLSLLVRNSVAEPRAEGSLKLDLRNYM